MIAAYARRHHARLHLHPRRVRGGGRHPRRRDRRGLRARLRRRRHPRLGLLVQPRRAPRRRRLHLRRGDRAARLARGQARQPAPEAAVPRQPGPLPGTDADQQRRDALERAAHRRARRRVVPQVRHGEVAGHEGRVGVGQRAAAGQLRGRARACRRATSSTTSPAARRRAARQGLVPGRLVGAGADRGAPRPALRLRAHGRGGVDARLRLDHRRRRLGADRVGRAAAGGVLPARVLRQVRALPRGHELDREDARAHRPRRGDADGPRRDGERAGEHHRQLPVRARRLDGDADRLDDQALPAGVRSTHRRGRSSASRRAGLRRDGAADLASGEAA